MICSRLWISSMTTKASRPLFRLLEDEEARVLELRKHRYRILRLRLYHSRHRNRSRYRNCSSEEEGDREKLHEVFSRSTWCWFACFACLLVYLYTYMLTISEDADFVFLCWHLICDPAEAFRRTHFPCFRLESLGQVCTSFFSMHLDRFLGSKNPSSFHIMTLAITLFKRDSKPSISFHWILKRYIRDYLRDKRRILLILKNQSYPNYLLPRLPRLVDSYVTKFSFLRLHIRVSQQNFDSAN